MASLLDELIGLQVSGHDITTLQLCTRGIVVFVWMLVLLWVAGKRASAMAAPCTWCCALLSARC